MNEQEKDAYFWIELYIILTQNDMQKLSGFKRFVTLLALGNQLLV